MIIVTTNIDPKNRLFEEESSLPTPSLAGSMLG